MNIFRKIVCKVADDVLKKKVRKAAENISEYALSYVTEGVLSKKFLSDRSREIKSKVREVEKVLSCELRRCKFAE